MEWRKKRVIYIEHSRDRMRDWGIKKELIEEAIRIGSKSRQEHRTIIRHKYVEVVCAETKNSIFVITVYIVS